MFCNIWVLENHRIGTNIDKWDVEDAVPYTWIVTTYINLGKS